MKTRKKFAKIFSMMLLTMSGVLVLSCAIDPGRLEAINSASRNCRNLVGIEISNLKDQQRRETKYGGEGVYVSAVIPDHSARAAGLKEGDVIIAINSTSVTEVSEALMVMDGLEAGKKYPFHVYRRTIKPGPRYFTFNILIEEVQERAIARIS